MKPLLELKDIDKSFPGVKALSGATLRIYPGRVMALVGENGAGKSTLMKVLTGIYKKMLVKSFIKVKVVLSMVLNLLKKQGSALFTKSLTLFLN